MALLLATYPRRHCTFVSEVPTGFPSNSACLDSLHVKLAYFVRRNVLPDVEYCESFDTVLLEAFAGNSEQQASVRWGVV
jgi:hypothetical protein